VTSTKRNPNKQFPIFVSSVCHGLWDLRARIYFDLGCEHYVFVDEQINKERDVTHQDDLAVADELITRIREANTFVCILGGSEHGSAIKVHDNPSRVFFLEIELFYATLLNKEIHLFVRDDFVPGPQLEAFLSILKLAFPEWGTIKKQSETEILSGMKRLIERSPNRQTNNSWFTVRTPIRRLVQALYGARAKNRPHPSIFFMQGAFESRTDEPRVDILRPLAIQLKEQFNQETRLSLLWIGIRELWHSPYDEIRDLELLRHWNFFLGEWAGAGAWYGLHGDTPLGCLAALNSQAKVRQRIAKLFPEQVGPDTAYPGGALASTKYSISKRLYISEDRGTYLNEALSDLQVSLANAPSDKSGLVAIRASVFWELNKISEAISDYEQVLHLRQQNSAPNGQIGEALSELGYGYLRQFKLRRGLSFCEEGVALLKEGGRPAFLARGLRKLSVAYLLNARLAKAYEAREELNAVAMKHGILDQL